MFKTCQVVIPVDVMQCRAEPHPTNVFFFFNEQVGDDSSSESSSVVQGRDGGAREIDWARCFSSVHQSLTNVMYFV